MKNLAQQFRDSLRDQPLDRASEVLAETAADLGWDLAAFTGDTAESRLVLDRDGDYIARRMGWPADYLAEWSRRNLAPRCPVAQRCGRIVSPFRWEAEPDADCWRSLVLLEDQREALNFYAECAAGAVTVPARRSGNKTGYVSWFSRSRRRLRRLHEAQYERLYLISHLFIERLDELENAAEDDGALTPRELQCLTWAARGKTEDEIGLIIGRSSATARFHLRNAAAKLDACNRTHAVAKACSRGLISVI